MDRVPHDVNTGSEPTWTMVSGVPTLCAPATDIFAIGVEFGVGRGDETFPQVGITHLVEHLAFPRERHRRVDANATVRTATTGFWLSGRNRSTVLDALTTISERLAALPTDEFESEREVLRVENQSRATSVVETALLLRFGAHGPGLTALDENALITCTPSDVRSWAEQWFAQNNAAMWMVGEPGDDVVLALRPGPTISRPAPSANSEIVLPSLYTAAPQGGVTITFTAAASDDVRLGVMVAEQMLMRRLRFDQSLTYSVLTDVALLPGGRCHVTLTADCQPGNETDVANEMLRVVDEIASYGPPADEFDDHIDVVRRSRIDDIRGLAEQLAGGTDPFVGWHEPTVATVSAAFRDAVTSLLVMVPLGTRVDRAGLEPYPMFSSQRLSGTTFRTGGGFLRRKGSTDQTVVVAAEGISIVGPVGAVTVLFADCAGMLTWADGTRALWGNDGFHVTIDPRNWRNGEEIIAALDAGVPTHRIVPMDRGTAGVDAVSTATGQAKPNLKHDSLAGVGTHLRTDETLVAVVPAGRERRMGLLAVTSARLLWLHEEHLIQQFRLEEIQGIDTRMSFGCPYILVRANDEDMEFTGLDIRAAQSFVLDVHGAVTTYVGPPRVDSS